MESHATGREAGTLSCAPEPAGDSLTVLEDAEGRALTKTYRRGSDKPQGYPNAAEFRHRIVLVAGFPALARELDALAREGRGALIRGRPGRWHPQNGSPVYRLLKPHGGLIYAGSGERVPDKAQRKRKLEADGERYLAVDWLPMFEDTPRRYVVLDVDQVTVPPGMEDYPFDPAPAVEHVLGLLPEPFREASCWWALSSSAVAPGGKVSGKIKLRLAFWLNRPLTGDELKRWLKAERAPVDLAVLGAVQPVYVAAPIFEGLHDPVPQRTGIWEGFSETVEVPELLPEPAAGQWTGTGTGAGFASADLEALGADLRARLDGAPHVRETLMSAAGAFVRRHRGAVDAEALGEALEAVALEHRTPGEVAAYNVPGMVAHCLEKQAQKDAQEAAPESEPGPHYPDTEQPADEAVKQLRAAIAGAVEAALRWDGEKGTAPQAGIKAAAGLGKTRELLGALTPLYRDGPGVHVALYVPSGALAEELGEEARRRGLPVQVVQGRSPPKSLDPPCRKYELARAVGKAGLPVRSTLCESKDGWGTTWRCEFFETCRYLEQFRDHTPKLWILQHAHPFQVPAGLPDFALVVIDESFVQHGIRERNFGIDRLAAPRPLGMKPETEAEIHDVARKVRDALEAGADPRACGDPETFRRIAKLEMTVNGEIPLHPGMPWKLQKRRMEQVRAAEAPKLASFWRALADECDKPRPVQRIVVRQRSKDGEQQARVHVFGRKTWKAPDVPVIVLDASLDPLLARQFLPRLEVTTIGARRNAEFVQVADTACAKQRLLPFESASERGKATAERRREDVVRLALREASGGKRVLLVTHKPVRELLGTIPGVDTAHFGALRGLDCYRDHDVVILAGRPMPRIEALEDQARALFGDQDEPLALLESLPKGGKVRMPRERRGYRMRDGSRKGAMVEVHPDPYVQALLEQSCQREMEQAIDRLRLIHRDKPARVLLLSNIPLDVPVDRLVTWKELLGADPVQQTVERLGILPLSPSELHRLAPDLWKSADAAKKARQRAAENEGTKPKEYTYWEMSLHSEGCGAPPPAFTLVAYRLPAQRGRYPHQAWLPGALSTPEAAAALLQAAGVGELARIELLRVERRPDTAPAPRPQVVASSAPVRPEPAPGTTYYGPCESCGEVGRLEKIPPDRFLCAECAWLAPVARRGSVA